MFYFKSQILLLIPCLSVSGASLSESQGMLCLWPEGTQPHAHSLMFTPLVPPELRALQVVVLQVRA